MAAVIFGLIVGVIGAGAGVFFAFYAAGFFQYLGGKKASPFAVSKAEVFDKLMALNDPSRPYLISRGRDTDLIAEWKIADASWHGIFSRNHLSKSYRARLLLDEQRHSVRCFEETGSVSWSAGLGGLKPNVRYNRNFFRGRVLFKKEAGKGYAFKDDGSIFPEKVYDYKFDVNDIIGPIRAVVRESGWEWVPVVAKRHATWDRASSPGSNARPKGSFCPSCGMKVGEEDLFCRRCGQKIG